MWCRDGRALIRIHMHHAYNSFATVRVLYSTDIDTYMFAVYSRPNKTAKYVARTNFRGVNKIISYEKYDNPSTSPCQRH